MATKRISANVSGSGASEDGKHADIAFSTGADTLIVRVPAEQLPHLIILAASAGGSADDAQRKSGSIARYVIPTTTWRALPHPDGVNIIQEFHMPEGQVIQLRCPKAAIPEMIKELNSLLGAAPGSSSRN